MKLSFNSMRMSKSSTDEVLVVVPVMSLLAPHRSVRLRPAPSVC